MGSVSVDDAEAEPDNAITAPPIIKAPIATPTILMLKVIYSDYLKVAHSLQRGVPLVAILYSGVIYVKSISLAILLWQLISQEWSIFAISII